MFDYFNPVVDNTFHPFSTSHWTVLIIIVVINGLILYYRRQIRVNFPSAPIQNLMASLLILLEISLQIWALWSGTWSIQYSLPLHLCGAASLLCAIMLLTNSYLLYEIVYFWGLAGASQALLTPDLAFPFPHFIFFQFFITHALVVTSCLWLTCIVGYRPSLSSVRRAFIVTNIYLLVIAVFDYCTGSNYLYLCDKPENPSLLDYLGPWPWYLLSMEFCCLLFFLICWLPFSFTGVHSSLKPADRRRH